MKCPKCKRDNLTESDFEKDRSSKSGLQWWCKKCSQDYENNNREKTRALGRKYYADNREKERQVVRAWRVANPDKVRNYTRQYAARKLNAYVAPVDEVSIYNQCGWVCQLCGQPVDATLKWPDPMSKSLDHIVPLSKGGTHEPGSVHLAHLVCNIQKYNKLTT